ncbi:UvrD-helicase domain-containing protein [Demequina sp. B12]|uniref:UvrD-helicase domain-containing protein n=1 Tax=Demequina sp. B12 TaxID=2992757 RepID=UPI00237B0676|nr:UvrD-helicase domain-containing protein [Demequina sp. B12]MDE0572930.1 UvrD-helicase domain-containing protein [Demequina sp. B12]
MAHTWTGHGDWTLSQDGAQITVTTPDTSVSYADAELSRLSVRRRRLRLHLFFDATPVLHLAGLKTREATRLRRTLWQQATRARVDSALEDTERCQQAFAALLERRSKEGRWIAYDDVAAALDGLPRLTDVTGESALERATVDRLLTDAERAALAFLATDHRELVAARNREIMARELRDNREFFANVEKSPLTAEQARAVVTYDSRVRVIAAAGSGKTSVMVARAAYAIARGFTTPDRVLMLAFNADAAAELQQRVETRFAALGLSSEGLKAATFHSFGLATIGQATGRKPRIAPWVEQGKQAQKFQQIVDELRDGDLDFRFKWDLFRLLYRNVAVSPDGGEPDSYDRATATAGYATYRGETVRSEGERLIADWLYLHGVDYRYEHPYSHDVADASHGQYRPDFYYPSIDVWHEHWALRADGTPPESFVGYAESMAWKKRLHQHYGTTLIETSWHSIVDHSGFEDLARTLEKHGVTLDWNPDRPIPGAEPLEHERLAAMMQSFMSHVKSGSLTPESLRARVAASPDLNTVRTRLFIDLYWRVHQRWQADLYTADAVDFDDMLVRAADLVERDPRLARYDLVMVDEFQDTSRTRARLTKALIANRGTHLLAVGDDWQAINRFAGADLSVMHDFSSYFGPSRTRRLETTFRCTQTTADVAGRFVSRNPSQLAKEVRSAHGEGGPAVTIVRVPSFTALAGAIGRRLDVLAQRYPGASVDVLGRYRADRDALPPRPPSGLQVAFRTVHRSKGLEADHVVVPRVTRGRRGFPSTIDDDPLLTLAMASPDTFAHAEERRLLYVALTRARQSVTLMTVVGYESPFILELLEDPGVIVIDGDGSSSEVRVCVACRRGTLVPRSGKYGSFLGCSEFPRCTATVKT